MADSDLNDVLLQFTNYVANERVRAYNEGVDAERERCARIADSYRCGACGMDGKAAAEIRGP